jgi:hypothetical protein
MSEIMEGVLRMPPDLWSGDALDVMQRHACYVQAADEITRLRAEVEAANQSYGDLFNKRAKRVQDLQRAVYSALNRKCCPSAFMNIAAEAVYEHGCGEIADLKSSNERLELELVELKSQLEGGEAVAWWNGMGQVTLLKNRPAKHYWGEVIPLYTHPAPVVPEGYVLVPIEPTEAMIDASMEFTGMTIRARRFRALRNAVRDKYKAMLSAAKG